MLASLCACASLTSSPCSVRVCCRLFSWLSTLRSSPHLPLCACAILSLFAPTLQSTRPRHHHHHPATALQPPILPIGPVPVNKERRVPRLPLGMDWFGRASRLLLLALLTPCRLRQRLLLLLLGALNHPHRSRRPLFLLLARLNHPHHHHHPAAPHPVYMAWRLLRLLLLLQRRLDRLQRAAEPPLPKGLPVSCNSFNVAIAVQTLALSPSTKPSIAIFRWACSPLNS